MKRLAIALLLSLNFGSTHADTADPFLWLEDAKSPQATAWADQQTKITENQLTTDPRYAATFKTIHDLIYSPSRLPVVELRAGYLYNFWQDARHPHGIYRRTTLTEFSKAAPNWEILFDLDALVKSEGTNWVWQSVSCLAPQFELCMMSLSDGGKDAAVAREYDLSKKAFVTGGFYLPEAKSDYDWIDANNLFVATDFGPGSLSKSGYARLLKIWTRGQPLAKAKLVLEATVDQMTVGGYTVRDGGLKFLTATKALDYDHRENYIVAKSGRLQLLPFPVDASVRYGLGGYALILTKSDWTLNGQTYPTGSLLAWRLADLAHGKPDVLFQPTAKTYLNSWQISANRLYISVLDNVQGQLVRLHQVSGKWVREDIAVPAMGTVTLGLSENQESDLLFKFESFLSPATYFSLAANSLKPNALKSAPARFNADDFVTEQFQSTSKDGTLIPYFVVHAKNWVLNASNPTLLYGYGGFESSQTPFYSGMNGVNWLNKGGVYVLANIRGGQEFGPAWHTSVLKENRQKIFDDFISVAEDLIRRQITSPAHLGIEGGSNGGLLVGATFVERPDLFQAVVCEVPLLDMIRYPLIGAGASWEAEYGDPADPAVRAAILNYSPYQNVKAGVKYPKVLFGTSRTDDRVGPAHARKMAAKMQGFGADVLFYEDAEGGHTGSDNLDELVHSQSLLFTYLYQQLMPLTTPP